MKPIDVQHLQSVLDKFAQTDLYLHLETTNGAYSAHKGQTKINVGAFIRNGQINYIHGKLTGEGPYRVGLKLETGWVYAEGLTHYEVDQHGRLLLAGHDEEGKLMIACELSLTPFE